MAAMQQIHIEVYSFLEEVSTLVQYDKSMTCLRYKLKQKLNGAMYEYIYFLLLLEEDISCPTLLTIIYRDLADQISLVAIRVRVTCSNIKMNWIMKCFHSLSPY
jgi:hypothetical protein